MPAPRVPRGFRGEAQLGRPSAARQTHKQLPRALQRRMKQFAHRSRTEAGAGEKTRTPSGRRKTPACHNMSFRVFPAQVPRKSLSFRKGDPGNDKDHTRHPTRKDTKRHVVTPRCPPQSPHATSENTQGRWAKVSWASQVSIKQKPEKCATTTALKAIGRRRPPARPLGFPRRAIDVPRAPSRARGWPKRRCRQ